MRSPRLLAAPLTALLLLGVCAADAAARSPAPRTRAPRTQAAPERPPVLLVTIDTLRWDTLGCYGGPTTTPALDELAASGARFEYALAHAVLTLPSHTSILTGLDPSRHGVHDNIGFRAADALDTWAERLQTAGYATGAFVGGFPLDSQFGLSQGFDLYDDYYDNSEDNPFRMVERPASEVVSAARRWIRRQRGEWFAWVHVYDPHAPYDPPQEYLDQEAGDAYRGEVAATDAALAPLLRDAVRMGATIIVTADHGEALGDHGERTHGVFAYEATLRVPLIIAGVPGEGAGSVVSRRVRHIDLLPTVLDLVGLPASGTQGESLLPLIRGEADPAGTPAPSYFEALSTYYTRNWAPLRGMYGEALKYIDLPVPELYDVAADPGEKDNLAVRRVRDMRDLDGELQRHLAGGAQQEGPVAEDAETLRRLQALGYLGGASGAPKDDEEYGVEDDPKNLVALDNLLQDATVAASGGELDEAERLLREIVAQRPDFTQAQKLLAAVEHRTGRIDAAIQRLEAVQEREGESRYVMVRLGFYYREAGRLDDAARVLQRTLELEPGNVEALTLLATVQGMQGRFPAAEASLEQALELDPTNALVHSNIGVTKLNQGQLDAAKAAFEKAIEYDPRLADAHNGLGVIAARQGDKDAAVQHWRTAVSLDPGQIQAMRNLAVTLVELERFTEAIEVLRDYVKLRPGEEDMARLLERLEKDFGHQ